MRIATLVLISSLCSSAQAQGTWDMRTGLPSGQGRWGAATFVIGNTAYVCGGYDGATDLNEVRAYDITTDQWSLRSPLPNSVRLASGFTLNGKGYVACGLSGGSDQRDELWEYDPGTDTWTLKDTFPANARYGMASFVIGNKAYVACGNLGSGTGPYTSEFWAYDAGTNTWTQLANVPGQTRFGAGGFALNGKGYVVGGRRSDQTYSAELFEYEPATNTWTTRNPLPAEARVYPRTFSDGGRGYVIAGNDVGSNGLSDGWAYHPATDGWSTLTSYPGQGVSVGTSFVADGRIFCGLGFFQNTLYTDLYEFTSPFVGLAELDRPQALMPAPNPCPSGGTVSFEVPGIPGQQRLDLQLRDATGRLVHQAVVTAHGFVRMQLPEVGNGLYTISLMNGGSRMLRGTLIIAEQAR